MSKDKLSGPARLIIVGILIFVLGLALISALDRNSSGEYVVVQTARGKMKIINDPVFFWSFLAKTKTYQESFQVYLSSSEQDGGKGAETQPIPVTFSDKGNADVSSVTKIVIPRDDELRLTLHRELHNMEEVKKYARSYIESVLKVSGSLYKCANAYSTERPAFEVTVREQLKNGKYATMVDFSYEETGELDDNGEAVTVRTPITIIKTDEETTLPIISDVGFFNMYGLVVRDFQIKGIQPDNITLGKIEAEKEMEQQRRLAAQEAETAKQQTITEVEQGKARIAEARANEEVAKITQVTRAEAARDVAVLKAEQELQEAQLARQRAEEDAQALLAAERAQAEANRLKVAAGLTPQERADVEKEIAIGVARELAKTNFPSIMNFGVETGVSDPLSAVGYNQMYDLVNKLSESN